MAFLYTRKVSPIAEKPSSPVWRGKQKTHCHIKRKARPCGAEGLREAMLSKKEAFN